MGGTEAPSCSIDFKSDRGIQIQIALQKGSEQRKVQNSVSNSGALWLEKLCARMCVCGVCLFLEKLLHCEL